MVPSVVILAGNLAVLLIKPQKRLKDDEWSEDKNNTCRLHNFQHIWSEKSGLTTSLPWHHLKAEVLIVFKSFHSWDYKSGPDTHDRSLSLSWPSDPEEPIVKQKTVKQKTTKAKLLNHKLLNQKIK